MFIFVDVFLISFIIHLLIYPSVRSPSICHMPKLLWMNEWLNESFLFAMNKHVENWKQLEIIITIVQAGQWG